MREEPVYSFSGACVFLELCERDGFTVLVRLVYF